MIPTLSKSTYLDNENILLRSNIRCLNNDDNLSSCGSRANDELAVLQHRLKKNIAFSLDGLDISSSQQGRHYYPELNKTQDEIDKTDPLADGMFVSRFRSIQAFLKYLMNNKLEVAIYIFYLCVFGAFVRILLGRQGLFR
jgi:hypothetical protein